MISFRLTQVALWLGISIWLGGLLVLGPVVAWQLFTTLAHVHAHAAVIKPQLNQPRELAGMVFGNILRIFYRIEWVCVGLVTAAVFVQTFFHLHWWNIWVWLRVLVLAALLAITLHDILGIAPQVFREHKLWIASLPASPAAAAVHRAAFAAYHADAEHDGVAEIMLLSGLLFISAWGINYPTRKKYLRLIPGTQPAAGT